MPESLHPTPSPNLGAPPASDALKRTCVASEPCESEEERLRKRSRVKPGKILKETEDDLGAAVAGSSTKGKGKAAEWIPAESRSETFGGSTAAVIDGLAQELKCGCCTELCYRPVIVNPCQHYFCGSCCALWVGNGGTNCPACRGVSTSVMPSRVLQSMIDLLLRADPARARTASERVQADQVYREGTSLHLPTPRPATPEANLELSNDNFARPCPTCLPGNAYGWRCPVPIADPVADPQGAFDLDDGLPSGHKCCGNCDQLHNVGAPTSSKCDICQVSFCGVGIQGRCSAVGLMVQQPHGMTELQDLILSERVYACFQHNTVEIDILMDYLRVNEISLHGVYKRIIYTILQQPGAFAALIDAGVFDDLHLVFGDDDPDPAAPPRKICRLCAREVLIHGLREWWIRERRTENLPAEVVARMDCADGGLCDKQADQAHAKEYNHITQPPLPPLPASEPPGPPTALSTAPAVGKIVPPDDVDMLPSAPLRAEPSTFSSTSALQVEVETMTESTGGGEASAYIYYDAGDVIMGGAEAAATDPDVVLEMLGLNTPRGRWSSA